MPFSLQSIRRFQKPLIFALAVFLMIAFGVPWGQLFGRGGPPPDRVVLTIRGREVKESELRDFYLRWHKVNPRLLENERERLDYFLKEQMSTIEEARRAGLSVPDAAVRDQFARHALLLRVVVVELAQAREEDFRRKAEVKAEEVEAYYNQHKEHYRLPEEEGEGYKELEAVRDDIEKILVGKKTAELVEKALLEAKRATLESGELADTAFKKAATAAGLSFDVKWALDNEGHIKSEFGSLADNEELTKRLFTAFVGELFGPFDSDEGRFIFRINSRSAGFDADGAYHSTVEGWSDAGFGEMREQSFDQLVARRFSPLTVKDVEKTLREQLLVARYQEILSRAMPMPTDTLRQNYYNRQEKARVDYLAFSAHFFRNAVEVSDGEVKELFNQYRDVPAPKAGGPGYLQPAMASLEMIIARKPDGSTFTDAQLRDFYNRNKKKYARDAEAPEPEYSPFEEVREQVKADLVDARLMELESKLALAAKDIEDRVAKAADEQEGKTELEAPDPRMKEVAGHFGLEYKKSGLFRQDGQDFYKVGYEFRSIQEELISAVFSQEYLTDLQLKTLGKERELLYRRKVVSQPLELSSGDKFFFRVIERKDAQTLAFSELSEDVLRVVRRDKETQKAVEMAKEEAGKMAGLIRADAFRSVAEALGIEPTVTEEFEAGELPAAIDADSALGKAAAKLGPGGMSRVIADGDSMHILLRSPGEQDKAKSVLKILTFPKDKHLSGPELTDEELADYLSNNIEPYADDLPLKGNAGINYIAAKYEDIEGTFAPTDEEIQEYYDQNEDEKFKDKALDDVRDEVIAAVKAEKARAEAEDLVKKALDEAKADDKKRFADIVEDTPLISEWASGIKLEDVSEKEFIGKAQNLARLILATKKGEVAGPVTTDEGTFFFRVSYKNPGKGSELWEELPDEAKNSVRAALAKQHAAGSPLDLAQLQFARYVGQAFKRAPEQHHIMVTETIEPGVETARQLSQRDRGGLAEETIEKLLQLEPNTLSEPTTSGNRACLFHVRSVQALKLAKIEYIKLMSTDFVERTSGEDYREAREKGKAKALAAARKIHAAAEKVESLKAALAAVEKDIESLRPLGAKESPYFSAGASNVPGVGWNLALFKKVFDLKPGEFGDIHEERDDVYLVRLLDVKGVRNARIKFVRVYHVRFITPDVGAEEAVKKAEEAMTTFREEAVGKGSLGDALETLKKALPEDSTVEVESEESLDLIDPPPAFAGKEELLKAIEATGPGGFTPVVTLGAALYVAQVEEISTPKSVTVDWSYVNHYDFENRVAVSDEDVKAYYEEHKEDYKREKEHEISYLLAKEDSFKEAAEKEASDEALKQYFEDNRKDYEHEDLDGNTVTPEFEDVKEQVRQSFVSAKAAEAAKEAIEAARAEMTEEDADLEKLAEEHNLEYKPLGFRSEESLGRERTLQEIADLPKLIFSLKKGEVTEVTTKGAEHYVFKVTDVKDAYIPELDEVETRARSDTDRDQQPGRALAAMGQIRAEIEMALAEDTSFEDAAKDASVAFTRHRAPELKSTDDPFTRLIYYAKRQGQPQYYGGPNLPGAPTDHRRFVESAFLLKTGEVSPPVFEENEQRDVYLLHLRELIRPDEPDEDDLQLARSSLEYVAGTEMVDEVIQQVAINSIRLPE